MMQTLNPWTSTIIVLLAFFGIVSVAAWLEQKLCCKPDVEPQGKILPQFRLKADRVHINPCPFCKQPMLFHKGDKYFSLCCNNKHCWIQPGITNYVHNLESTLTSWNSVIPKGL